MLRPFPLTSTCITALLSLPAYAESFQRPIPQAQSATAEVWFALASLTFCVALYLVYRAVAKR